MKNTETEQNQQQAHKQSKKAHTGLGKGLGALLDSIEISDKGFRFTGKEEQEAKGSIAHLDVTKIQNSTYQPRKDFDKEALERLKNSILEHGVIQPVTVRKIISGYELIAGERRLRATIAAGIKKIPAYIIDVDTGVDTLSLALIENLQREDLNPIEIANGYQRLIEECHLTQEQVSVKVSKDRSTVTNFLRLLRLPDDIQESLRQKEITMGHARALLSLPNQEMMLKVWAEVKKNEMSVRTVESLVKDIQSGKVQIEKPKASTEPKRKEGKQHVPYEVALALEEQENKLRHIFGTKVKIQTRSAESGTIEFEFYSMDDFERLIDLFSAQDQSGE